jgi:murein DD-endopeptidase MepM/ murein hydrolase activator NlpD
MKRPLQYILVGFGFLILANYLLLAAENIFHGFAPTLLSPARPNFYDGLPTIHFSFFEKGGIGWSFITQGYGRTPFANVYPGNWHDGIDIAASYGAPIYSAGAGIVVATGNQDNFCWHRAFGKYVAVKDGTGAHVVWYAHLGDVKVSPGQEIASSTVIGTIGETGFETGPHLHLSVFDANGFSMAPRNGCGSEPTGRDIDPIPYLRSL